MVTIANSLSQFNWPFPLTSPVLEKTQLDYTDKDIAELLVSVIKEGIQTGYDGGQFCGNIEQTNYLYKGTVYTITTENNVILEAYCELLPIQLIDYLNINNPCREIFLK